MSDRLLKSPNVRGDGISTVERLPGAGYSQPGDVIRKRQRGYFCRPLWNFCRQTPLVRRERRALLGAARAGVRVPRVLAYHDSSAGSELITECIDGALPLRDAIAQNPDARDRILQNAAFQIGNLHRARWTHGALYSDHILVTRDFSVSLIDLEKGRRSFRAGRDLARFYRHNDYLDARDREIFSAAYDAARLGRSAPASQDPELPSR